MSEVRVEAKMEYIAPCGLYCGVCPDNIIEGICHGCGCTCEKCAAKYHHKSCYIYQCATGKGFTSCADCDDLPCTHLIEFAFDPIWRTHLPVLENLKRIKKIGYKAWMEEQQIYWSDKRNLDRFLEFFEQCSHRSQSWIEKQRID
jgi:hypothetical protein